jgi:hypothetical protein
MADRPKVGEADEETRRRKLREALDQPTRATGVAPRPSPAKPEPRTPTRRYGPSGKTIDEIVDEAVNGAHDRQNTDRHNRY